MKIRSLWLFGLLTLLAGCRPPASAPGGAPTAEGRGQPPVTTPAQGTLQVSFLDVGQGDAALVQAPGGVSLLIDGGPREAGPRVLAALRAAGVTELDWVLGSHPHEDHIGGLLDVLPEVPVRSILDPGYAHGTQLQRTYLQRIKERGAKLVRARAGQKYNLGSGARLEILAPEEPLLTGTESDANNNSIVARLVFGRARFLFTGDMEEDERRRLMQSVAPEQLRADVLKVAHHGSHNGTDPEFLRAVDPDHAVISLARGNDYGHPHREVLQALGEHDLRVYRTDESGDIVFRVTEDGLIPPAGGRAVGGGTPPQRNGGPAPVRRAAVIGNASSQVYHAPDCGSLPEPDNRRSFASVRDAEAAGFRPHRACQR